MLAQLLTETPGQQPVDVTQLAGDHPVTAIAIIIVSGLFALAPQLLGRMKAKDPSTPASLPAATAQVDATGQALLAMVASLERSAAASDRRATESDRRAAESEQRHDALERRYYDETNDLREQLRVAKTKIADLEAQIERLRERLMGRGFGG